MHLYIYIHNMVRTRSAWSRVPGFLKHVNMIATKKMQMDQHGFEMHFD